MKVETVIFDLDGTLIDTEPQYTKFWLEQGVKYYHDEQLGLRIKGSTLTQILNCYFTDKSIQKQLVTDLNQFEQNMDFKFVDGAISFLNDLKQHKIKTALVTSSNLNKMKFVYAAHPELKSYFDLILTAENFSKSKPDPECFLTAAKQLNTLPESCIVFEDSHFGIDAANKAGMFVVGLSTTVSVDELKNKVKIIIPDFKEMNLERLMKI